MRLKEIVTSADTAGSLMEISVIYQFSRLWFAGWRKGNKRDKQVHLLSLSERQVSYIDP